MPIINKNTPNILLRMFEGTDTARFDPKNAPITPKTTMMTAILASILLCLIWIISAITAVGIKYIRLILCATCWSTFNQKTSTGMRRAPPPMPIPLMIPERIPTKTAITNLEHHPYCGNNHK